jgi:hypothetical protein
MCVPQRARPALPHGQASRCRRQARVLLPAAPRSPSIAGRPAALGGCSPSTVGCKVAAAGPPTRTPIRCWRSRYACTCTAGARAASRGSPPSRSITWRCVCGVLVKKTGVGLVCVRLGVCLCGWVGGWGWVGGGGGRGGEGGGGGQGTLSVPNHSSLGICDMGWSPGGPLLFPHVAWLRRARAPPPPPPPFSMLRSAATSQARTGCTCGCPPRCTTSSTRVRRAVRSFPSPSSAHPLQQCREPAGHLPTNPVLMFCSFVSDILHADSPIRGWLKPGGLAADADSEVVVVVSASRVAALWGDHRFPARPGLRPCLPLLLPLPGQTANRHVAPANAEQLGTTPPPPPRASPRRSTPTCTSPARTGCASAPTPYTTTCATASASKTSCATRLRAGAPRCTRALPLPAATWARCSGATPCRSPPHLAYLLVHPPRRPPQALVGAAPTPPP